MPGAKVDEFKDAQNGAHLKTLLGTVTSLL